MLSIATPIGTEPAPTLSRAPSNPAADTRLRRTVFVDEARLGRMPAPSFDVLPAEHLAADDERAHAAGQLALRQHVRERLQVRRGDLDDTEIFSGAQRRRELVQSETLRQP